MSILQKVKKNINEKKFEKDIKKIVNKNIEYDYITIEGKTFLKNGNIDKIRAGDFGYFPIECLLNQYILKDGINCYYVALDDERGGNSFEIYEFNYAEEDNIEYRKLFPPLSSSNAT